MIRSACHLMAGRCEGGRRGSGEGRRFNAHGQAGGLAGLQWERGSRD